MRSLTPTTVQIIDAVVGPSAHAARLAIDPEDGVLYATVEERVEFGLDVRIVKLQGIDEGTAFPEVVAKFNTPALAPFHLPEGAPQTVDVHYFPDDRSVIVLLAGGDIAVLQIDDVEQGTFVEVVGSIDSGIKAAAWSPDDEQLLLITGEDNLVCMTRSFDTIYEAPLRRDDFGEDKFVNVGWGSKTTQFHGSLGKAGLMAARASAAAPPPESFAHGTDDGLPRITFRGDGAYVAVSSLDPHPAPENGASPGSRRQVRIYTRDASMGHAPKLSATSESLPGLESALAWRPSGNVIASLVRYGYEGGGEGRKGRWDVAMLERNGLRHGGFELREAEKTWENGYVQEMAWNADSEVLAIWIRREEGDVVQLWTMKNYHYYLKQEITPLVGDARLTSIKWHPEHAMRLYLVSEKKIQARTFVWDTYASRLPMPNDTATVAVVDGDHLLMTPFRTQNVPPPMSSYKLTLPERVVHVSMSPSEDALAVIFRSGLVQVWDLNTRLPENGESRLRAGGKPAEPKLRWEKNLAPDGAFISKQVGLGGNGEVAALFWGDVYGGAQLRIANPNEIKTDVSLLPCAQHVLWEKEAGWLISERDGVIRGIDECKPLLVPICARPSAVAISAESRLVFSLSDMGRLMVSSLASPESDCHTLATAVTSFTATPDFLIYTTSAQTSHYAPFFSIQRVLDGAEVAVVREEDWDQRRVERGALAVVACPSSMSLVLQMPRGNLETVYPRALVLAVVRRDVLKGAYRQALLTCRKHRLDLNVIYDLDPKLFIEGLPSFVEQIPESDYLNLFVSALNSADCSLTYYKDLARDPQRPAVPADKVNTVCDALRGLLENDLVKYVETILTTHVCKQPPDYEAGLRVLLHLQAEHPAIVEEAIKYIIFLSNVNQLYNVALGMYNFQLVLMIAQYSQKDPKEYLPFLRKLRALDTHEQRFRIDDHLGRRESALRNLQAAGPERFEDASSYLSRYELYDTAFDLYKDDKEHLPIIYELYGDYLYDRRDFHDAAISYVLASKTDRALKAYEKAHAWRELFTLAKEKELPRERVLELVERVNDHLASRGRHLEASQVYLDYAEDVDGAVDVLCRGAEFGEAYRITSRFGRAELVEELIHPALDEAHEALIEVFDEMSGQLDKEMRRLVELHRIRLQDPDTFYLVDNEPELENVDVATNATTVATAFTRYTVAPTTAFSQSTKMTGHTNKTKHKKSKRRQAGRKGTVDEYDYLVASLGRLVVRVDDKSAEALPLIRHLILATAEHRALATELQTNIKSLRERLATSLDDAWRDRETILDTVVSSGGMGLGGNVEPARALEKPEVKPWAGVPRLA